MGTLFCLMSIPTTVSPAHGIPGLAELMGLYLEASHGILASWEVHLPELTFRSGIFIYGDAAL